MRTTNIVSGIALLLLGLAMFFWIIPAQTLSAGASSYGTSPRFLPMAATLVLIALSIGLIISNFRIRTPDSPNPFSGMPWGRMASGIAIIAAGAALMGNVGTLVAFPATILGSMWLLGERRALVLVVYSVCATGAVWWLFAGLLGSPLP